jgi:hypothetical protein
MAAICCLTVAKAEQDLPQTGENRQSKQLFYVPQYYSTPQSPFFYPESSSYGNPFMVPSEVALVPQQSKVQNWPWAYPSSLQLGNESNESHPIENHGI